MRVKTSIFFFHSNLSLFPLFLRAVHNIFETPPFVNLLLSAPPFLFSQSVLNEVLCWHSMSGLCWHSMSGQHLPFDYWENKNELHKNRWCICHGCFYVLYLQFFYLDMTKLNSKL